MGPAGTHPAPPHLVNERPSPRALAGLARGKVPRKVAALQHCCPVPGSCRLPAPPVHGGEIKRICPLPRPPGRPLRREPRQMGTQLPIEQALPAGPRHRTPAGALLGEPAPRGCFLTWGPWGAQGSDLGRLLQTLQAEKAAVTSWEAEEVGRVREGSHLICWGRRKGLAPRPPPGGEGAPKALQAPSSSGFSVLLGPCLSLKARAGSSQGPAAVTLGLKMLHRESQRQFYRSGKRDKSCATPSLPCPELSTAALSRVSAGCMLPAQPSFSLPSPLSGHHCSGEALLCKNPYFT